MTDSAPKLVNIGRAVVPHLVCERCADAIEFYKQAFGAEEAFRLNAPGTNKVMHAELLIAGQPIMLADDFPEFCDGKSQNPLALGGTSVSIHRQVDDCDAAMDRAIAAGAVVRMPAADMFWGDRYGMVIDPFGHCWTFGQHLRDVTVEEMTAAMVAGFEQAGAGEPS